MARAGTAACEFDAASGVVGLGGRDGRARSGVGGVCPGNGGGEGVYRDEQGDDNGGIYSGRFGIGSRYSTRRKASRHRCTSSRH